jgi:hypothetical protein
MKWDGVELVDGILRQRPVRRLATLGVTAGAGFAYGLVMGSFAGSGPVRPLLMLYSGLKVPLLILVSFAIGLPSWFVLNALLGLRDDFPSALRAMVGSQAVLLICLASLAPLTLFVYICGVDYTSAILFNGAAFAVASFGAHIVLRRAYAPLVERRPRHRLTLPAWFVIYVFVAVQMGWVLRPFIGKPGSRVEFFRTEAWDNAYVVVARMITEKLVPRRGSMREQIITLPPASSRTE